MLKGKVQPVSEFSEDELSSMYSLMAQFYDNTDEAVFRHDFFNKDYCLVLRHETDGIVGFTTQKIMEFDVDGKKIHGIFSGDTITHKEHWGDIELFRVWAKFWFEFAEKYDEFYWFLICKGYKTYRIMPLFWTEFYPNYRCETPAFEQSIINAYASELYPDEYDSESGVIVYKGIKDKLKNGVADVGDHEMKNKDIAFFCKANPDYIKGNDLACLTKIDRSLLKKHARELLFK